MLINGIHTQARLVRIVVTVAIPLALLSYGALWIFRMWAPGPVPVLYAKIGYVLSAISIFIAFRVNQAYGRWWDARKLWGQIINESRSWARLVITHPAFDPALRRTLVHRQIVYAHTLRISLRVGTTEAGRSEMQAEVARLLPDDGAVSVSTNVPTTILTQQASALEAALRTGPEDRLVWRTLTESLRLINEAQGGCERIKKTVFPAAISQFTQFMVWALAPLITFAIMGDSSQYDIAELVVVVIVTSVFVVIERLARDLQDPFEGRPNDIPLSEICRTIETELREMLEGGRLAPDALPPPTVEAAGVVM